MVHQAYNLSIHRSRPVWVFPKERFFEWEPKDEPFCRAYGVGHEEARQERLEFPAAVVTDFNILPSGESVIRFRSYPHQTPDA